MLKPAMDMKRCEKMDSWIVSNSGPIFLPRSWPTWIRMLPWPVISNLQFGSTRIVLNLSMMMQGPDEVWPTIELSYSVYIRLFKHTLQFLQQLNVEKCPSSLQCWNSNPRPS